MLVNRDRDMGKVLKMGDYLQNLASATPSKLEADASIEPEGLVPLEYAVASGELAGCLAKLYQYGKPDVHVRQLKTDTATQLHFLTAQDAIWINKKILECEELGDEEVGWRIDLIQALENSDLALMDNMWKVMTQRPSQADRKASDLL